MIKLGEPRCHMLAIAFALTLVISPSLSHAETPALTETMVLQAAMRASPDFQAVFRDSVEEKADAEQISRLENPSLQFDAVRTSAPGGDVNSYEWELEQPFKLSQLSGARSTLSRTMFERAELRRQHGLLQAFWNTKILYAQVWQYQQQAKLYSDFQKSARDTANHIGKAVKAGQTPISDGSLFSGDVAKFGSDLEKIEAQKAQLLLQLEKATGLNLSEAVLEKPHLKPFDDDIASLERQARQNASLVRLLETDLRAAERQKSVAVADGVGPQITPRLIYGRSPNANEDAVGVGIALSIPLWDRNQAERQKAEAARVYAQRQLDTLQSLPLSDRLERTVEAIKRIDRRIKSLEDEALPNYRKGFQQAQKSFNAGQTNAATLWQIRERLFETERDALDVTLEAVEARRILSLETGDMPQEIVQ